MKKLTCTFFIICLAVPFLGTYAWLKYRTQLVRREVRRRITDKIDKGDLTHLAFSKDEAASRLDWEHADEFEYNGRMYDVVDKDATRDSVHYWCWADDSETEINHGLNNLAAHLLGNTPQQRETQKQFFYFLTNLFHSEAAPWSPFLALNDKLCLAGFNFAYASASHAPPAPPPERVGWFSDN